LDIGHRTRGYLGNEYESESDTRKQIRLNRKAEWLQYYLDQLQAISVKQIVIKAI